MASSKQAAKQPTMQTSKHTHPHAQCSNASVARSGLPQLSLKSKQMCNICTTLPLLLLTQYLLNQFYMFCPCNLLCPRSELAILNISCQEEGFSMLYKLKTWPPGQMVCTVIYC